MTIDAVGASATSLQSNSMGMEDFLKVLLTQLTYQDPLKPMDNQEFMAQMAQFTAVEQSQQINDRLDQLIGNQAALQSVGLIGRTVSFTTSTGAVESGSVVSLSLSGQAPVVSITTTAGATVNDIALSQIALVR